MEFTYLDGSFELREESGMCFVGCTLFFNIQIGVDLIYMVQMYVV